MLLSVLLHAGRAAHALTSVSILVLTTSAYRTSADE
jgi:hypothetical protein